MKLRTLITLALISLLTLAAAGCSKETPAPEPSAAKPSAPSKVEGAPVKAPTEVAPVAPVKPAPPVAPPTGLTKDERAKASQTYAIQASKTITLDNAEAEAAKLEQEIDGDE